MSGSLVWVDLETTGLDARSDSILEVGLVITDGDLNMTATTARLVAPTRRLLGQADPVVRDMHAASGLTRELEDGWGLARVDAERVLVDWLSERVPADTSPMCGSSVNFDRGFLNEQMPILAAHFHYRNIDVSTIKELVRRWYPQAEPPHSRGAHRALLDLRDSINELRFYREHFFIH